MKFLSVYRRVKDVFVPPKLKWYFGPFYRSGPRIYLSKKRGWNSKFGKYYTPNNRVQVFEGYSDHEWNGKKIKRYGFSTHKLPGKLTEYSFVWNREIRKKLRKWHLSWIPPVIELPRWLNFGFYDSDIQWKTKWSEDDYRYEFPAHITLVIFGFAIRVIAEPPKVNNEKTLEDDYWETILTYKRNMFIEDLNKKMGYWTSGNGRKHWVVDPKFFKNKNIQEQLIKIQNEKEN